MNSFLVISSFNSLTNIISSDNNSPESLQVLKWSHFHKQYVVLVVAEITLFYSNCRKQYVVMKQSKVTYDSVGSAASICADRNLCATASAMASIYLSRAWWIALRVYSVKLWFRGIPQRLIFCEWIKGKSVFETLCSVIRAS